MCRVWYDAWNTRLSHVSMVVADALVPTCRQGVCNYHSSVARPIQIRGVIKRKLFPRYWPFVRGIHRSPVNSPHKGQWRRALMFSLICARINGWVNNREAGDLRRHQAHCDVIVMDVTSLLTHWSYVFLALTHRYVESRVTHFTP